MEKRSGKQCRERYVNQLDPLVKKSMWTLEEDAAIKSMHYQFGKKWSKFMEKLPGRSDNAIKNRYHIISRNDYSELNKRIAENEKDANHILGERSNLGYVKVPANASQLDRFRTARDILDLKIAELLNEQQYGAKNGVDNEVGCQNVPKVTNGKRKYIRTLDEDPDAVASAVLETCPDLEFAFCVHPSSQAARSAGSTASTEMEHSSSFSRSCTSSSSDEFQASLYTFEDFNFDYDELFHEYDYGQYLGGAVPAAKVLELAPTAQKAVLAELAALTAAAAASSGGASVTSTESNSMA
jgi:hypothetical protein